MEEVILLLTLLSAVLVIYHHVIYPIVLKYIAARRPEDFVDVQYRYYKADSADEDLPQIEIIMPAYNEQDCIAEKIRNLSSLDYPLEKLFVKIVCDGCSDNTADIARSTIAEMECSLLNAEVCECDVNRGKLAVINEAVTKSVAEIVVLTDVSALLPVDALLFTAADFGDEKIGGVSGGYTLMNPRSEGESYYWKYQTQIKCRESATGSVLGSHGAFYAFRRELFDVLDENTINDDFVLPMNIAAKGWRVMYDPRVCSLEIEQSSIKMDAQRRLRISAGNMQQLFKLFHLLNPRYGWLAFNFLSGKALRAVMPFLLLIFFLGSIYLAFNSYWFAALAMSQVLVYGLVAMLSAFHAKPKMKLIKVVDYLVRGHWSGLLGASRYLLGLERGRWNKVGEEL
jgi:cellulose synthase/poly-beta-1,6-N-acetylglucosamine synthase-like glycosyltransferase